MRKYGFTRYYSGDGYRLEVWCQPWLRWFWAYLYSRYFLIYKVPGYKALDKGLFYLKTLLRGTDPFTIHPWSVKQDLRLCDLQERKRKVIIGVKLDKDQFNALRGSDE